MSEKNTNPVDSAIKQLVNAIDALPIEEQAHAVMRVHQHNIIVATVALAKLMKAKDDQVKLGTAVDPAQKAKLDISISATKVLGASLMSALEMCGPGLVEQLRNEFFAQLDALGTEDGIATKSE